MGGYDVAVDRDRNRLYLEFRGMIDDEDARAAMADVEAAVEELEPGFTTVNDISEFRPSSQDAVERIEAGKELVAEAGNVASVRVTGESVIGELQWSRVGEGAESFEVATAETVAEADDLLDDYRS